MTKLPETKTKFRLFVAWNDAKETAWLSDMSRKGWHLTRSFLGLYTFEKGEPAEYAYEIDFHYGAGKSAYDRIAIQTAKGWAYVAQNCGYHYFRIDGQQAERQAFFATKKEESLKYKRLLSVLNIPLVINMLLMFYVMIDMILAGRGVGEPMSKTVFMAVFLSLTTTSVLTNLVRAKATEVAAQE